MNKKIKKKLENLKNYLIDVNVGQYHHSISPEVYRTKVLDYSDNNDCFENLLLDLGLEVYIDYAVKEGLKNDIKTTLAEYIAATKDVTGNDDKAVVDYQSLYDKVNEWL